MVVTINGKPVKKPQFKTIKKLYGKYKESRKPEVQLAKIKAKQELLKAKANLRQQKMGIAQQRAKLRGMQMKSAGINLPKFVSGTQQLSNYAFGGGKGMDMANVLSGGEPPRKRKGKGKPFDPFSQF